MNGLGTLVLGLLAFRAMFQFRVRGTKAPRNDLNRTTTGMRNTNEKHHYDHNVRPISACRDGFSMRLEFA